MNAWIRNLSWCLTVMGLFFLVLPSEAIVKDKAKEGDKKKHDHPDKGPNGGPLAEWGDDEFHAEFTIDTKTKQAVIYVLDDHAKNAPKIDPKKITNVKLFIPARKLSLALEQDVKRSGAKGIAFVGTHDAFGSVGEFKGTINGKVNGKPYSGDFHMKAPKDLPKEKEKASFEVKTLMQACKIYATRHAGQFPDSLAQLLVKDEQGGPYLDRKERLIDPWGKAYSYDKDAPHNKELGIPDISTMAPDGTVIGNWSKEQ